MPVTRARLIVPTCRSARSCRSSRTSSPTSRSRRSGSSRARGCSTPSARRRATASSTRATSTGCAGSCASRRTTTCRSRSSRTGSTTGPFPPAAPDGRAQRRPAHAPTPARRPWRWRSTTARRPAGRRRRAGPARPVRSRPRRPSRRPATTRPACRAAAPGARPPGPAAGRNGCRPGLPRAGAAAGPASAAARRRPRAGSVSLTADELAEASGLTAATSATSSASGCSRATRWATPPTTTRDALVIARTAARVPPARHRGPPHAHLQGGGRPRGRPVRADRPAPAQAAEPRGPAPGHPDHRRADPLGDDMRRVLLPRELRDHLPPP